MGTDRSQHRYEQLIQEELSKIILRELDVGPGTLVTVTQVAISADFSHARVYLTVFPDTITGTVLKKVRKQKKDYQYFLADIVRSGRSPQLDFFIDEQAKEGFKMDEVLDQITEELAQKDQDSESTEE